MKKHDWRLDFIKIVAIIFVNVTDFQTDCSEFF